MLRNISEERESHLHRDGSPKSRIFKAFFLLGLLDHEDEGIVILRKVGKLYQPKRPNIPVSGNVIFRNISLYFFDLVVKVQQERLFLIYP
jgi:hypothetical protein